MIHQPFAAILLITNAATKLPAEMDIDATQAHAIMQTTFMMELHAAETATALVQVEHARILILEQTLMIFVFLV